MRSYTCVADLYTVEAGSGHTDPNTGLGFYGGIGVPAGRIEQPSSFIVLVEPWGPTEVSYFGSPSNAVFTACDGWKLPGRRVGVGSLPPPCNGNAVPQEVHAKAANYLLADTSANRRTWGQVRANDFAMFKRQKSSTVFVP